MPRAKRVAETIANGIKAETSGSASRLVRRKYLGKVPKTTHTRGAVNSWQEMLSAMDDQIQRMPALGRMHAVLPFGDHIAAEQDRIRAAVFDILQDQAVVFTYTNIMKIGQIGEREAVKGRPDLRRGNGIIRSDYFIEFDRHGASPHPV